MKTSRKNPKFLVIDDDPAFCHTMKKLGEREKFEVVAYSSARTAYRELEYLDYDVAVVDYDLGMVTGAQLSNFMARNNKNQPIVLISSSKLGGIPHWSQNVRAVEEKSAGAYRIFFSALRAYDEAKGA